MNQGNANHDGTSHVPARYDRIHTVWWMTRTMRALPRLLSLSCKRPLEPGSRKRRVTPANAWNWARVEASTDLQLTPRRQHVAPDRSP
jgi:hypothetical protein